MKKIIITLAIVATSAMAETKQFDVYRVNPLLDPLGNANLAIERYKTGELPRIDIYGERERYVVEKADRYETKPTARKVEPLRFGKEVK